MYEPKLAIIRTSASIEIRENIMDNSESRKYVYVCSWRYGHSWNNMALLLKIAADKVLAAQQDASKFLQDYAGKEKDPAMVDHILLKWFERDLFPVYMLLIGYALENAFKGIIACRTSLDDCEFIKEDDFANFRVPVKNGTQTMRIDKHGLRYLLEAKALTLEFSEEEKGVMDKLDLYVQWCGRYPIPREYGGQNIIARTLLPNPDDELYKIIDAIYDKAMSELKVPDTSLVRELYAQDSRV